MMVSRGPGIIGECAQRGQHVATRGLIKFAQVLAHPRASLHAVAAGQRSAPELGFDLLQRDGLPRLVPGGVSLGGVLGILGRAQRLNHRGATRIDRTFDHSNVSPANEAPGSHPRQAPGYPRPRPATARKEHCTSGHMWLSAVVFGLSGGER